jgi:hypothetical protein
MMKLSPLVELNSWNERFVSFNDAVMKSWAMKFALSAPVLEVVIETQDQDSPSGWSLVTIHLSGVSSLKFCEGPKTSYQVLSNGLHTLFDPVSIGLEFGDFIDAPESFSELMESPCHVVAESLDWDVQFIP